jgi:hypothetical protein
MKKVSSVTGDRLEYIDDDGERHHIDLRLCNDNWIHRLRGSNRDAISDFDMKCVAWRKVDAEPHYIEFFMEPPTRFEFAVDLVNGLKDADVSFYELQRQLRRAGWVTIDLS